MIVIIRLRLIRMRVPHKRCEAAKAADMSLMGKSISGRNNPHRESLGDRMRPMAPDCGVVFMSWGTNVPYIGVRHPINHKVEDAQGP